MMYIFDSNILIRSKRQDFSAEEHSKFWDWLAFLGKCKKIGIPEIVYKEIGHTDELGKWIKQNEAYFKTRDSEALPYLNTVTEAYNAREEKELSKINNDAFVIAHALSCKGVVVTYEKFSETTAIVKQKIPNICKKLSIQCITLPAFLWQFITYSG